MKHLILLLIIVGFFSCKNSKEQNPKYNAKAIELNNKAIKLLQNNKLDSALILFDHAIELDDNFYMPHSNKIGIYLRMKEYNKALFESEIVIKKKPDGAEGWFVAGILNEHQGNNKKAITYYKKSIKIFTDRINNPDKQKNINTNKLNLALSKKFVGDESYIVDFNELREIEFYSVLVDNFIDKTKEEVMNELIK